MGYSQEDFEAGAAKMAEELDGAIAVHFVPEFGLVGACFGGSTFNVYNLLGDNVDAFTRYSEEIPGANRPTPQEARMFLADWARELQEVYR